MIIVGHHTRQFGLLELLVKLLHLVYKKIITITLFLRVILLKFSRRAVEVPTRLLPLNFKRWSVDFFQVDFIFWLFNDLLVIAQLLLFWYLHLHISAPIFLDIQLLILKFLSAASSFCLIIHFSTLFYKQRLLPVDWRRQRFEFLTVLLGGRFF